MTATRVPDVTVITAVYNTMPYLTGCLNSLVGQSIGLDRMQIVAVDDGSTDSSGKELDRFAERYPETFTVIHQPNSGGPAAPSNRGLELAKGRYVYFIGSDDYLGAEALERMVAAADKYQSDIVVGKMVGAGGRYVHQALFKSSDPDVSLYNSALPWTLNNCKLFRRELIERQKLRFPEDMPVGSDQPFTIEACVRARRISVLADYEYYYAVRREDAGNITYRSGHERHLAAAIRIMDFTAGLIEAGPNRDAVLKRHFTWELAKLLQHDFLDLDRDLQRRICAGVAEMAGKYLTDRVRYGIDVKRRVRLTLAEHGLVDVLCEAIRYDAEHGLPPTVLDGGKAYARYPGFRDGKHNLPDGPYQLLGPIVGRLGGGTETLSVAWEPRKDVFDLVISARVPVVGDTDGIVVRLMEGAMPKSADKFGALHLPADRKLPEAVGRFTIQATDDGDGTIVHARIPVEPVEAVRAVRLYVDAGGRTYEIPLRAPGGPLPILHRRRGLSVHRYAVTKNKKNRLVVKVTAVPLYRVLALRLRRLLGSKRK